MSKVRSHNWQPVSVYLRRMKYDAHDWFRSSYRSGKIYDHYDVVTHTGSLPVRVLQHNIVDWFEKVDPKFLEEVRFEVDTNDLKRGIAYHFDEVKISDSACIAPNRELHVYENYNAFLWIVSYCLIALFDEGVQKPLLTRRYDKLLDENNPFIQKAHALFEYGMVLFDEYLPWDVPTLPNPERYLSPDKTYVRKANAVFAAAMTFILCHEFAHQYYGTIDTTGLTQDEIRQQEYDADLFAYEKAEANFHNRIGFTFKAGMIAGLASLIFLDNSMKGGPQHPDPDDRLYRIIEKMDIRPENNLWGIASLAFLLWGFHYKKKLSLPSIVDNYKALFLIILDQLRMQKVTP